VVHTGIPEVGLYGCDTRHTFSSGEHAHGAYCVTTRDTVLASETASCPMSTWIGRPNPSSVVFVHRPFAVATWYVGL
jgi:hypothetical protein